MGSRLNSSRSESGFTLLEVVVSVAVFTIVMGAVYGVLKVARGGRINTNQRTEMLQNVRVGLNAIGRDAINAGVGYPNTGATIPDNKLTLLNLPADADTVQDLLMPVYAGNGLDQIRGENFPGLQVFPVQADEVTFLYVDDSFNGGKSLAISGTSDPAGTKTILTVAAGFTNDPCTVGDIYLVANGSQYAIGVLTKKNNANELWFENTDPMGLNHPGAGSALDQVTGTNIYIWKLQWVTYWVNDEDGAGPLTGTLTRRVYGGINGTTLINWTDQPMAFGIEDMQIQYILKDGSVGDSPTVTQMDDIRQVRVTIMVRSSEIDPQTKQPYESAIAASFSTRNLFYEKL